MDAEFLVIGAGAAGLAAARALGAAGRQTLVIEGRGRLGGRILTRTEPGLPIPIDLGAEFIHGRAEVSFRLLCEAGTVAIDTAESGDWVFVPGQGLQPMDGQFERAGASMQQLDALVSEPDVSVATFLQRITGPDADQVRASIEQMVIGFDAADPEIASVRAIAAEWSDERNGQTGQSYRPLGGYAPLVRQLRNSLDPLRVHIALNTIVRRIEWSRDGVTVLVEREDGERRSLQARAAVVTLPVGILRLPQGDEDGVTFSPPLPAEKRSALDCIVMGPVVKVVMHFVDRFWEEIEGGRYVDGAFFRHDSAPFPTIWTLRPMRAPVLVAWSGGPRAAALEDLNETEVVARALGAVEEMFGARAEVHERLEAAYVHNWQADRFARGAYSYLTVGGLGAREVLAQPLGDVLFFAGEATAPMDEAGTVAGALASGERAAREVLAAK